MKSKGAGRKEKKSDGKEVGVGKVREGFIRCGGWGGKKKEHGYRET